MTLWAVGPSINFRYGWNHLGKVYLTFGKVKDYSPTPIDYKTIDLDYKLLEKAVNE